MKFVLQLYKNRLFLFFHYPMFSLATYTKFLESKFIDFWRVRIYTFTLKMDAYFFIESV